MCEENYVSRKSYAAKAVSTWIYTIFIHIGNMLRPEKDPFLLAKQCLPNLRAVTRWIPRYIRREFVLDRQEPRNRTLAHMDQMGWHWLCEIEDQRTKKIRHSANSSARMHRDDSLASSVLCVTTSRGSEYTPRTP